MRKIVMLALLLLLVPMAPGLRAEAAPPKPAQKKVAASPQQKQKKNAAKATGRAKAKKQKKVKPKSAAARYFSNFQIGGALEVGGALYFKDTPDQTVDDTLALLYGARLAFLFGHYRKDDHRFGIAVNYDVAAKSSDRTLMYITPYLIYNIGYPFTLEAGLGYAISVGTEQFAEYYDGLFAGLGIKYTFNSLESHSPVGVALGVNGKFILPFDDLTYTSSYVGVSLEIMYRSNKPAVHDKPQGKE